MAAVTAASPAAVAGSAGRASDTQAPQLCCVVST
jgi:hypothetical protein